MGCFFSKPIETDINEESIVQDVYGRSEDEFQFDFDIETPELKRLLYEFSRTCWDELPEDEKIKLCQLVTEADAEYIKTSTGFGTAGAKPEDIVLFKENIGENVKIKAAGGIRTKEDMVNFIELGCSRIGTSGAIKALAD